MPRGRIDVRINGRIIEASAGLDRPRIRELCILHRFSRVRLLSRGVVMYTEKCESV